MIIMPSLIKYLIWMWDVYYDCSYLTDEETKAQKDLGFYLWITGKCTLASEFCSFLITATKLPPLSIYLKLALSCIFYMW